MRVLDTFQFQAARDGLAPDTALRLGRANPRRAAPGLYHARFLQRLSAEPSQADHGDLLLDHALYQEHPAVARPGNALTPMANGQLGNFRELAAVAGPDLQ